MRRANVIIFALGLACGGLSVRVLSAAGPARKPVAPPVPYLFKSAAALAELEKTLGGPGAHGGDLVKPGPVAVEVVWKHEQDNVQKEIEAHDGRDHVFFVTDGRATFTVGGELDGAHEISTGEWRAPQAKGAQTIEAKKGDLLFIPHGTPHSRTTKGSNFTMLQLSFWPGGAPKPVAAK
jgi:quercetin dioxygenase-like cupin family protein